MTSSGGWYTSGTITTGTTNHSGAASFRMYVHPMVCEACGNEIESGDHISVQIGEDDTIYFHKACYLDPVNQDMVRSLVVAEDLMNI